MPNHRKCYNYKKRIHNKCAKVVIAMSNTENFFLNTILNGRRLSIIVFSLFFSWMLAFPFQGQILYALSDKFNILLLFALFYH